MYHPDITQRDIDLASKELGWPLKRHTVDEIDDAIEHFDALMERDGNGKPLRLRRSLLPGEQKFIRNERKLCALDFRSYWLPNYAWIIDLYKQATRCVPNVAQNIILDLWAEDESRGHAIWMQQLKARRLGVSTLSELNVCHRFQFHEYSSCLVASADPGKSIDMAGMIKFCLEKQPWWLLPRATKTKHGMPAEFAELHTELSIESGNQFTGVGRGASPSVIHLSELCEFQDAEDIITGGLLRAVIDSDKTFGILESTALGIGNWWHKEWQKNKREMDRGTARIRPVFLPWFVGTDLYPTAADRRKRPIPPDWSPSDRTIKHAERARAYVLSNPLLFHHLAHGDRDWTLPRHQMYWYENEYRAAKENKELHIFLGELPADDIEAFQIQQNPLIDQEILMGFHERTRQPLGVYTIIGPDIPPQMVAPSRQFDSTKPTITIATRDLTPNFDVKYQLIPLQFHGYSDFDEQLKLLIWEWPTFPHRYGVGVDCSEGVGQDNATIEVLRESTPLREPGQVAEWVGNTVTAFQLWPLVMAMAHLYSSTTSPQTGEKSQCRLAIETWTNGAACQNELLKRGWANFHPMQFAGDSKRPKALSEINRIGVMTNSVLRSALQDMWMTHIKEEAIDIPSPYLVQEITTLENVEGKAQALLGFHDDRWMGLGFPLLSLHQGKRPDQQFTRKRVSYQPGLTPDQQIPHPTWSPPSQASSRPFAGHQRMYKNRRAGALERFVNPNLPIRYR